MTYISIRNRSNLEQCLISHRLDWLVSFLNLERRPQPDLITELLSNSLDWLVDFNKITRTKGTDPLFTEVIVNTGINWAVAFGSVERIENLGYDDRVRALGATWFLPTREASRYTEVYDDTVVSLGATWFLPTINGLQDNSKLTYSDTVSALGATWQLSTSMADIV